MYAIFYGSGRDWFMEPHTPTHRILVMYWVVMARMSRTHTHTHTPHTVHGWLTPLKEKCLKEAQNALNDQ